MEEYNNYSDFDSLPPLKRFSLLHKQKHQPRSVPTTPDDDDDSLFILPAKKRMNSRVIHSTAVAAAALGAEMVTTFSLPTKKRVRSFHPGFVKICDVKANGSVKSAKEECGEDGDEFSLPAKKRKRTRNVVSGSVAESSYGGPVEVMTSTFPLPNKKRVMAFQPDFVSFSGFDLNVEYKPEHVDEVREIESSVENKEADEGKQLDMGVENVGISEVKQLEVCKETVETGEAKPLEVCIKTVKIGDAKQLDLDKESESVENSEFRQLDILVENVEGCEAKKQEIDVETLEIGEAKQQDFDIENVELSEAKQLDFEIGNVETGEAKQLDSDSGNEETGEAKQLDIDTGNVETGEAKQLDIGLENKESNNGTMFSQVMQELGLGDGSDEEEDPFEISEEVFDVCGDVVSFDGGIEINVECQVVNNPAGVCNEELVDCRDLQDITNIGGNGYENVGVVLNSDAAESDGAGEGEARQLESAIEIGDIDEAKKLYSSNENVENSENKLIQVFEELGLDDRFDEEETPDEIIEKESVGCGDLENVELENVSNLDGAVIEGTVLENVTSLEDVVNLDGKCEGAVLKNVTNIKIDGEFEDLQEVTNSDGAVVAGGKFEGIIPPEVTEKEIVECLATDTKGDGLEDLPKAPKFDAVVDDGDYECEDLKDVSDLENGVDEESEDGIVCEICQSTDAYSSDPIVLCDGCDLMVHASCYGNPLIQGIPEGDWFCHKCASKATKPQKSISCCLCPSFEGALKPTNDGRWAHLVCAVFVPEVFFIDPEGREVIDVSKILPKRWKKRCYVCQGKKGCVVHCSESKCSLSFHVTCGLKEDLCIEYKEGKTKRGGIVSGFCKDHTKLWKKQQQTGKFKIVAREE